MDSLTDLPSGEGEQESINRYASKASVVGLADAEGHPLNPGTINTNRGATIV